MRRLVAAICAGCGGEIIFFSARRRAFPDWQLRCPNCVSRPASADLPKRAIAAAVLQSAHGIQRALDLEEPDSSEEERIVALHVVADELLELAETLELS